MNITIKFSLLSLFSILLLACGGGAQKRVETEPTSSSESLSSVWEANYTKIEAKSIDDNLIRLIGEDWMLITAGERDSFNMMTANWGGMGFLYNKPVTFIFIRESRYTHKFLMEEPMYTMSFFSEEHREALKVCGSNSGRDTDKVNKSGLTPVVTPEGLMAFGEAKMVFECRKIVVKSVEFNDLVEGFREEAVANFYGNEVAKHTQIISEIVAVWVKK